MGGQESAPTFWGEGTLQGGVKRARINRTAKMNIILKHNKTTNHVANSATGEPLGEISHKEKSGC